MSAIETIKEIHYSEPAYRGALIRAQIEAMVAGRRASKTHAVVAERVSWNAFAMPRSLGFMCAPSYKKFLINFIPSLKTGFAQLGYTEGDDYVIGRWDKKWERPHHSPHDATHLLHWRSGSAEAFVSQDVPGSSNGLTTDRGVADEFRYINVEMFEEETLFTMSGHPQYFGGMSEHRSLLLTTDMPYTSKGRAIFKYKEKMDSERIDAIIQCAVEIDRLERAIDSGTLAPGTVANYRSEIYWWKEQQNTLRIGAVYYHEADTVSNMDVIGPEFILDQYENQPKPKFLRSILNIEPGKVEGGFYPDLSEHHEYVPRVTSYTTSLGYDDARLSAETSLHDAELSLELPLEIFMDYGSWFNCMGVGQLLGNELRCDKEFHVYKPQMTIHVVHAFDKYYRTRSNKDVYYWFDHTAKNSSGLSEFDYKETVIAELTRLGWNVIPMDIGRAWGHHERYELYGRILREKDPTMPRLRINRDGCPNMLISMNNAGVRQGKNGFEKDKDPERDKDLDQATTTHYSEAMDNWVCGRILQGMDSRHLPVASMTN